MRASPSNTKTEALNHPTISSTKTEQQQEDVTSSVATSSTDSSLAAKRRNRWENPQVFTERQTTAQHTSFEDELHIIAQTTTPQSEPTTQSNDIPQPSKESIVTEMPGKSKWDDDDDDEMTTESIEQHQIQPET